MGLEQMHEANKLVEYKLKPEEYAILSETKKKEINSKKTEEDEFESDVLLFI